MTQVTLDMKKLLQIEKMTPQKAGRVVAKLAGDSETYIKDNFSDSSPAPAGSPPGVDTGNLKNSIVAQQIRPFHWELVAGAEYAHWLEYGTLNKDGSTRMEARPFFLSGVRAVIKSMPPDLLKAVVE